MYSGRKEDWKVTLTFKVTRVSFGDSYPSYYYPLSAAELLPAFPSVSVGTHYVSNRHVGRLTVLAYQKALYREFNRQGGFRLARKFTSYKAK